MIIVCKLCVRLCLICNGRELIVFLKVCSPGKTSVLRLPQANDAQQPSPVVRCSRHMCPIRVHWHVKQSYKEYWRVKITITNLNFVKNYSQWNLVVLHPNMRSVTQVFSFNYQPLPIYGNLSKLLYYSHLSLSII